MIKRILAIALAIMLSGMLTAVNVSAAEAEQYIIDDITILNKLGVIKGYEDGQLHPEYSITRMEYAAIIIRCLGLDDAGSIGVYTDTGFPDVAPDSWGAGYIRLAKDLGLINGYANGNFGPNDLITVVDAAKIIVSATGHNVPAEAKGGYPGGYISVALQNGVLDGIQDYNRTALREDIAKMIVNSLETEFVVQNMTTSATKTYAQSSYTMLEAMGITKIRDKVTAVYGFDMSGKDFELEKDEVVISDKVYTAASAVDASVTGLDSYIYIRDYFEDTEARVLLVIPQGATKILTVDAADVDEATTVSVFKYYVDNKLKSENLEDGVKVVYNGLSLDSTSELTDSRLIPGSGSVTLIDTDNNGSYDTVFVKDYETLVVKGIREDAIFDIYGNNVSFDEEKVAVTVIKNGAYAEYADIEIGDVISVGASLDLTKIEILISDSVAEGTVETLMTENGTDYYTLSGSTTEYKMTDNYLQGLSAGYSSAEAFDLGDRVKWYLNSFGEIAYTEIIEEKEGEYRYGWLDEFGCSSGGIKQECYVRIVSDKNLYEGILLDPDKKITFGRSVSGSYVTTKEEPSALVDVLGTDGDTKTQLIKYALNEDGNITELYLLDSRRNTANFSQSSTASGFNFSYGLIENTYVYDNNTVVFHLPSQGQYIERISAGRPSDYFATDTAYTVELYDVEPDTKYVNLIVYTKAVTDYNELYVKYVNSPVMLVTGVKFESDETGEFVMMVEGYQEGKKVKVPVSDRLNSSQASRDIKAGSIIQYQTDAKYQGYAYTAEESSGMAMYNVLFDCNLRDSDEFALWNYAEKRQVSPMIKAAYTTVDRFDFPIMMTAESNDNAYSVNAGTKCYRFDLSDGGSFEEIDANEIQQGDKVFIRKRYNYVKEIVIVE